MLLVKWNASLNCFESNYGGFYTQAMLDKQAARGKAVKIVEEFAADEDMRVWEENNMTDEEYANRY